MQVVCVPFVPFYFHCMKFQQVIFPTPAVFMFIAFSHSFAVRFLCDAGVNQTFRSRRNEKVFSLSVSFHLFTIIMHNLSHCRFLLNCAEHQHLLLLTCLIFWFQGCYMTIHITPEPDFSYVSFESNVAASNYGDLISRVIKLFQPGKFVVTIFANKVRVHSFQFPTKCTGINVC